MCDISIVSIVAHTEITVRPSRFLLANPLDQLEHDQNLCGELFHCNVKVQIAWIPDEITEFRPTKWNVNVTTL